MIIQSQPLIVPKAWGREVVIANNAERDYCGKILELKAGTKFSMHFHRDKHETFYVLSGLGVMRCLNTENASEYSIDLRPNVAIVIPPLNPHQVVAETNMQIIEFSTYHRDEDSYRVAKGDSQK